MPKRKAEGPPPEEAGGSTVTSDTPKKKSKKERLEEAIAKAKKAMEEDKKNVQITIQNRLAEGKSITANIKLPTQKATAKKTPRKSISLASSKTAETKVAPLPASTKKASPAMPVHATAASIPAPSAAVMPAQLYPPNQAALQFQMYQQALAQAGVFGPTFNQQLGTPTAFVDPYYQQMMPMFLPSPAPVPPAQLAIAPKPAPVTSATKIAPAASKKNAPSASKNKQTAAKTAEDSDDNEEIVPSPTQLQHQVSIQVMENFQASLKNLPTPHTKAPQEVFSPQNTGITQSEIDAFDPNYEDSDPINMDPSSSSSKGPSFFKWLSGVVAAAAIISSLLAGEKNTRTISALSIVRQQCYLDTVPQLDILSADHSRGKDETTRRVVVNPCSQSGNAQLCPDLGFCSEGILVRCTHEDFEVDEAGLNCKVKQSIHDKWTTVLVNLSVQQLCTDPRSPLPVFDYLRLAEEKGLPYLDMKVLKSQFHLEHDDDGTLWLGLSDSHPVAVPMSCRLQQKLKSFFQAVYYWTLSFIKALLIGTFKYAWLTIRTYPRESLIVSVILGTYYWYTTFNASKRQIIIDTARMRDMALDKLRDASDDSHYVMALRDDVIADLTPYDLNDKKRKYFRSQIWPRVLGQFVGDNRLRHSQHMDATNQKVKLYYQWVASKSAKKKSVRINVTEQ